MKNKLLRNPVEFISITALRLVVQTAKIAGVANYTHTAADPVPSGGGEGPAKHVLRSLSIIGSIQGPLSHYGAAIGYSGYLNTLVITRRRR